MKLYFLSVLIGSIAFVSCHPSRNTIKQSNRDAMVDSIVGTKMDEINKMAMDDLKIRIDIEVKSKADSIVKRYTDSLDKKADSKEKKVDNNPEP